MPPFPRGGLDLKQGMIGQLRLLSRLQLEKVVSLKSGLGTVAQSQAQYCQKKRKSRLFTLGNMGNKRPVQSNSRTRSDVTSFPTKAPVVSSSPFLFPTPLLVFPSHQPFLEIKLSSHPLCVGHSFPEEWSL